MWGGKRKARKPFTIIHTVVLIRYLKYYLTKYPIITSHSLNIILMEITKFYFSKFSFSALFFVCVWLGRGNRLRASKPVLEIFLYYFLYHEVIMRARFPNINNSLLLLLFLLFFNFYSFSVFFFFFRMKCLFFLFSFFCQKLSPPLPPFLFLQTNALWAQDQNSFRHVWMSYIRKECHLSCQFL